MGKFDEQPWGISTSGVKAEIYQEWINNDRRLRAIIDQLRAVAAEATELILEQARQADAEV